MACPPDRVVTASSTGITHAGAVHEVFLGQGGRWCTPCSCLAGRVLKQALSDAEHAGCLLLPGRSIDWETSLSSLRRVRAPDNPSTSRLSKVWHEPWRDVPYSGSGGAHAFLPARPDAAGRLGQLSAGRNGRGYLPRPRPVPCLQDVQTLQALRQTGRDLWGMRPLGALPTRTLNQHANAAASRR